MSKDKFAFWLFASSLALFIWLFAFFLKPFIVASLLVMSTSVFSKKLENLIAATDYQIISANKELLSAFVLTLALGIVLFVPVGYAVVNVFWNITEFRIGDFGDVRLWILSIVGNIDFLGDYLTQKIVSGVNTVFSPDFWVGEASHIFQKVGSFLGGLASSITELALIVVFFFLLHWFKRNIVAFIKSLLPLSEEEKELLTYETVSAISIVFLALIGIVIAQGFAFFILMLFFDYNAPLLGFFTGLSSIVPIFGTALVWVPIAINEFIKGNVLEAAIISVYSWFVMAFLIDNFLRLILLNQVTKLFKTNYKINEFLLFFSIAAGIGVFGFWGFIIGPSITAIFLSSARLYAKIYDK